MTDQSSAGHCWQRGGWSFIWWTVSCIAGHLAVLSPVHEKCIAPCPCVKLEHCVPCLGVWYSSTQPPLTLIKVQLLALGRPCPECRAPWRGFLKQNSSSFARKKRAVSAGDANDSVGLTAAKHTRAQARHHDISFLCFLPSLQWEVLWSDLPKVSHCFH